jgi:hypothetical protein
VAGEVERHLFRCLEVELVRLEAPVVGVLERVAGLDAEERLVRGGIVGVEVVDVARRDERQGSLCSKIGQLRDDLLLNRQTGVLQLYI